MSLELLCTQNLNLEEVEEPINMKRLFLFLLVGLFLIGLGSAAISSSGATITTDGPWVIYTFLGNGTFNTTSQLTNVTIMAIAGGGSGGSAQGGGGGAGAYMNTTVNITGNNNVIIGRGGIPTSGTGGNGTNTTAFGLNLRGGGGGGSSDGAGNAGGSGGGGGASGVSRAGGAALPAGFGQAGGASSAGGTPRRGGAGGGAIGVGAAGVASGSTAIGGLGAWNNINGTNITWATGGNGGSNSGEAEFANATNGTGNGGGGGNNIFGAYGGSGIVILRVQADISITLNSPTNNSQVINTVVLNWTSVNNTAGDLVNTTLYINESLEQTISISGSSNTTTVNRYFPTLGLYSWIVTTCTATSCVNSSLNYFTVVNTFIVSINYSNSSVSTQVINITANLSSTTTPTLIYLNWNGTNYSSDIVGSGSYYTISNNISLPSINSQQNITFFYYVIWTGNNTITQSFNQTLNTLQNITVGTTACTAGFYPSLNFTLYKEVALTIVNISTNTTTINYNFQYGAGVNNSQVVSGSLTNTNNFTVCVNSSITYYIGYGEVDYSVAGTSDRKYYVFNTTRLTNSTINISLYSLETSLSTAFQITATSTTLEPYTNNYITLLRWYPNLNEYRVVDMGKTDNNGQTVVNVKTNDVDYRLGLYTTEGLLIKLISPVRLTCQVLPCVYSLITDIGDVDLTTFLNVANNLSYNSNTKMYTFIWNDPSQKTNTMRLYVVTNRADNTSLTICNTTASGYVGVLSCNVSAYSGLIRAEAWRTASPQNLIASLTNEIRQAFSDVANGSSLGLFLGFLLALTFGLIGIISPVLTIMLSLISLIPSVALGNITFAVFMILSAIAGVMLHFLRRTSQ